MPVTLVELFPKSIVLRGLDAKDKKSAIKEMVQHLVEVGRLTPEAGKKAERAVNKREGQGSTGIGKGLAIPHAKGCTFTDETVGVFARSLEGIPFDSVDGGLVHVLFLVLSPKAKEGEHTEVMKRIARLLWDEKTLNYLARDAELKSLQAIFKEVDDGVSG
jgi:mannitol/fructose-specific phosphotransferase system IIA component (Ntr-type)